MSRTPQQWYEEEPSVFHKPSLTNCDFANWEVKEGAKGPVIATPQGNVSIVAKTIVRQQPSRWNDDPRAQLTIAFDATPELISFVRQLEDWALPKITGREEPRSVLRTNAFAETLLRAKITSYVRWFDREGNLLTAPPELPIGAPVYTLLSVSPYRVNGLKGLSIRALAVQPA